MPNPLHSVLNLIAATILADKRVYAAEVETFVTETSRLELVKRLEPNISQAQLLSWYEINKEAVAANLTTPYFQKWFYGILNQVGELADKETILGVMEKVARADNDVHVSEKALIKLAERYWD